MASRFTAAAFRERIADLLAEADNIHAVAEGEQRDLNEAEQTRFGEIFAELGNDGGDKQPKTGLYAQVEQYDRLERMRLGIQEPSNNIPRAQLAERPEEPGNIERRSYKAKLLGYQNNDRGRESAYRAGRWLAAALFGDRDSRQWCADAGMNIRGAMSTGDAEKGGYVVPQEFSQAVIDLREARGVARQWASVVPMASDSLMVPRRKSGVTAYAVTDNDTITASDKEFNQVELIAKKWAALTLYSTELAEDSFIDLADNLAEEFAYAFADKEDESLFNGDGTSTYHGVRGLLNLDTTNNASSIYTAITGNTSFAELDLADFENALGQVPQYAIQSAGAAWFISRVGWARSIQNLINAAGGNTSNDLGAGPGMEFLGLPVVISQVLNTTTDAQTDTNIAAVGNLRLAATIGDRRMFSVATSADRYFEKDQLAIRGTSRVAINVHELGGVSTAAAGPIIVIRTPSS